MTTGVFDMRTIPSADDARNYAKQAQHKHLIKLCIPSKILEAAHNGLHSVDIKLTNHKQELPLITQLYEPLGYKVELVVRPEPDVFAKIDWKPSVSH